MALSGCYNVIKYLHVLINLIFWIVGILVVALAVWMLVDPTFYLSMAQEEAHYYIGLYALLASGALLVIVALLGCCGAIKESQCMLISFFCILLIGVVGEAAAIWWGAAHSGRLVLQVRSTVENTVRSEYDGHNARTAVFDAIQNQLQCCGARSPADWAGSEYSKKGLRDAANSGSLAGNVAAAVGASLESLGIGAGAAAAPVFLMPASCCTRQGELCEISRRALLTASFNPVIFNEGCADKVVRYLTSNCDIFIGIGVVIAALEILGLTFALILCCAINSSDRYKA